MADSVTQGIWGKGWWDTLCLPTQTMTLNGTSNPTREAGTGYLLFPASGTTIIVFGAMLPLGWVEGSDVIVDARWAKTTPVASPQVRTGDVTWSMRYRQGVAGVAMASYSGAYAVSTVSADTPDDDTDDVVLLSNFGAIDLTDATVGTFLQFEVSRRPAANSPDLDTYPESARLISVDLHFQRNAPGAFNPYFKYDPNVAPSTRYAE